MPGTLANDDRTRDQPVDRLPRYILVLLASLSAFSIGTYLAWSSSALSILGKIEGLTISKQEASWICASVPLGATVGSLPARIIADKIGRRKSILLSSLLLSSCWFVIGFARSKLWISLSRVAAGAACGASSILVPTYVSEIADEGIRESLWTILQLQIAFGVLFAYATGFSDSLLLMAILCAFVPGFLTIASQLIPESSVWLIAQDRRGEADAIAKRFGGRLCLNEEETWRWQTGTVSELRNHGRATIIALGLTMFQQLSGVNAVTSYARRIFEHVGFPLSSTISALILGLTYVIATLLSTTVVDRVGRKLSLFLGMSIMSVCMFVLSGYFRLQKTHEVLSFSWLPFFCLVIFIGAYSVGCGQIPWIIVDKIFPNDVRWTAITACVICYWTSATVATKCFQDMVDFMGMSSTFATYGMVSLIGISFVAILVPETEGKSVEELQIEMHETQRDYVTCI
ncbi:facilitated trehalose transporter Tret1-like [Hylaeus volcanicus]|uniref:facilitated trehalose transporter Tret1-like n=1 Tax=Hylaeus volcanicus TaxID=313075 RepID=UPI0023B83C3F|nr:facilitated trehalose transporter Tret1-like [Hylaeus volcanicus]XP_053975536.1 facilitated trehalose transporter Tret1-like [Hylaeus volcanicus]